MLVVSEKTHFIHLLCPAVFELFVPSKKTKELPRSCSSKTIFLKPVDSTLKKKLELAGHIQSKSYQNENNDIKIVQWNTGTIKSTGKQSSETL